MNYRPKAIILGVIFTTSFLLSQAQQESMYTHYMFNTLSVNPAYAGSREAFTITALHRSQWAGFFENHPITQTLTMHSPTPKNENIGLGLSLYNDRLGPEKSSALYADFAYRIRLTESSKLAFGLKAGVSMHSIDYLSLSPDMPDDPNLVNNERSMWLPNFGFGLYYSRERFYTGISIPRIMEENYFDNSTIGGAKFAMQRHFYFIAGTLLHLSDDVDLRPTSLVKITKGAPIELDVSASFIFYERFILGAMYRTRDAIGALAGFKVSDQWTLGYSFDWSVMNKVPNNNFGSHEIVLRYDFIFLDSHRVKSPRYF